MIFGNLPTLVPPNFWITHPLLALLRWRLDRAEELPLVMKPFGECPLEYPVECPLEYPLECPLKYPLVYPLGLGVLGRDCTGDDISDFSSIARSTRW